MRWAVHKMMTMMMMMKRKKKKRAHPWQIFGRVRRQEVQQVVLWHVAYVDENLLTGCFCPKILP